MPATKVGGVEKVASRQDAVVPTSVMALVTPLGTIVKSDALTTTPLKLAVPEDDLTYAFKLSIGPMLDGVVKRVPRIVSTAKVRKDVPVPGFPKNSCPPDGETEGEGLKLGLGDTDGDREGERLGDAEGDKLELRDGLGETEGDKDGDRDGDKDGEKDTVVGENDAIQVPQFVVPAKFCVRVVSPAGVLGPLLSQKNSPFASCLSVVPAPGDEPPTWSYPAIIVQQLLATVVTVPVAVAPLPELSSFASGCPVCNAPVYDAPYPAIIVDAEDVITILCAPESGATSMKR